MNKRKLIALDVFAGCGGLSLGIKKAGFRIGAAIEINPKASFVYGINHPGIPILQDIRDVSGSKLLSIMNITKISLDLFAGCPPCQGFSRLRTKNNHKRAYDPRNGLIMEFLRLIIELKPKTILFENVPNISKHWRFEILRKNLLHQGYYIDYAIVDAADYGVPQRRKRLVLMASHIGPIKIPNVNYGKKCVRSVIGSLPEPTESNNQLHRLLPKHSPIVAARISEIPKNGGNRKDLGINNQLPCHRKENFNGFKDVYGRMKWDDVSPTLTRFCSNPSKGRFLHPDQDRAISPYEAALLQTFPHSYKFPVELGRTAICSMIGEAFPPRMAQIQATYLFNHILSYNNE
ncbi:MAG: DNA cytosine methyltransferase [Petrotogales bacterium]